MDLEGGRPAGALAGCDALLFPVPNDLGATGDVGIILDVLNVI